MHNPFFDPSLAIVPLEPWHYEMVEIDKMGVVSYRLSTAQHLFMQEAFYQIEVQASRVVLATRMAQYARGFISRYLGWTDLVVVDRPHSYPAARSFLDENTQARWLHTLLAKTEQPVYHFEHPDDAVLFAMTFPKTHLRKSHVPAG